MVPHVHIKTIDTVLADASNATDAAEAESEAESAIRLITHLGKVGEDLLNKAGAPRTVALPCSKLFSVTPMQQAQLHACTQHDLYVATALAPSPDLYPRECLQYMLSHALSLSCTHSSTYCLS